MALQKPIVYAIAAFDAANSHTVKFYVNGGDQVTGNRAIIRLGSTNEIVYDQTQTTFTLEHTIPANTLINGNYYTIQIQTLNVSGGSSAASSPVSFYCYDTPQFEFSNLPQDNVIQNAGYEFELTYQQLEGEALSSYIINVYNSSQSLIWSSDVVYVGANGVPPTSFKAMVSGFEDNSFYYIRAQGQTEQLTELDTGLVLLTTAFDSRSIYTQLALTNNECEGYIMITSNVISLDGITNPNPPTYIGGEEIDLSADESYVVWDNAFAVYNNYTLRLWLRDVQKDAILCTLYDANNPSQILTITEREEIRSGTTYMYLEVSYTDANNLMGYLFTDEIVKPNSSTPLIIWLQQNNGLYDIRLEEVSS